MIAKKINAKDFLINNGIIVVLLLLAVFTGNHNSLHFFTLQQPDPILPLTRSAAIHHRLRRFSGCLITKGTDLSAGRMVGLSACYSRYLTSETADYSGKFFQNLPDFGNAWPLWSSRGSADLRCSLLYFWFHQWYRNFLLTGSGFHRNSWYAADSFTVSALFTQTQPRSAAIATHTQQ